MPVINNGNWMKKLLEQRKSRDEGMEGGEWMGGGGKGGGAL